MENKTNPKQRNQTKDEPDIQKKRKMNKYVDRNQKKAFLMKLLDQNPSTDCIG